MFSFLLWLLDVVVVVLLLTDAGSGVCGRSLLIVVGCDGW